MLLSNHDNASSLIESWLKKARQRYVLAFAVKILPLFLFLALVPLLYFVFTDGIGSNMTSLGSSLIVLIMWLLAIGLSIFTKGYQLFNRENFLFHLNRQFERLEESAQLLIMPASALSLLQRLQKDKTALVFYQLSTNNDFDKLLPKIKYIKTLIMLVFFVLVTSNALLLKQNLTALMTAKTPEIILPSAIISEEGINIIQAELMINPPSYTKLPSTDQKTLDLALVEGSKVTWRLQMSDLSKNYQILLSDETLLTLVKNGQDIFTASSKITQTVLYRIAYGPDNTPLEQVYAIAVQKDKPAKITIIEPIKTVTEIAKNGKTEFTLKVLIKDDYGVEDVHILASVAKGSGEGVKFRDQQFTFEQRSLSNKGHWFEKNWQLTDLGMEPGDEVYFTVYANDNKSPEPQQSRSATFIVRWLDEEQTFITADGIVIDFIPEYFRSQRQIIIETEQLISDQEQLSLSQFSELSEDLGRSQADLKQRYGQYLGDEFGGGAQDEFTGIEEVDHDGHESDDHKHQQSTGGYADKFSDKSGAQTLMARFGHDHGEADIGPVLKKNPKALMKRAVSVMWQAELHLMLSEPKKALPYEKEAYKFLKLAQQADRIYVKRLGFEPPPVKENKRLTGELTDILTYSQQAHLSLNNEQDQVLFSRFFQFLTSHINKNTSLTKAQKTLLKAVKIRLTALAQTRPALIKQAVTVERILLANNVATVKNLSECDGCLRALKEKVWQLLVPATAKPSIAVSAIDRQNPLYRRYQQQVQLLFIEQVEKPKQTAIDNKIKVN